VPTTLMNSTPPPRLDIGEVSIFFGEKNGKYPDGNQVVVRGGDTLAVFDSPLVSHHVGLLFDEADLCILGHAHEDHITGLPRIPSAEVRVHERDLEAVRSWAGLSAHYGYPDPVLASMRTKIEREFHYQPRPEAQPYADGAQWSLGGGVTVTAFHMPGHTAGHCVLLVEPAGVAFIGDIDLSSFGPYYGDGTSSLAEFRQTLATVADIPARAWVTSHHKGAVTDRAEFLQALAAFSSRIDARTDKLLGMLAPSPKSLATLVRERLIYPPSHGELWVDCVEARTIAQHLDELMAQGRVRLQEDGCYALAPGR
jgi:glyoxylase-like metal-dependent hydrolase (beta-lactamase superfamily II)